MGRKVLLASMRVGGGHTALRDSFAQSIRRVDPNGERLELDLWECADQSIEDFYKTVVRHFPFLQWTLATLSDVDVLVRLLLLKERQLVDVVKKELVDRNPDIVVCTHFMQSIAFVQARNELQLKCRIVTAIPDYGIPKSAFFARIKAIRPDHVIVMEETAHMALQTRRQLPASILHFGGFLTREPFTRLGAQMGDKRLARAQKQNLVAELLADNPQLHHYDPSKPTFIFLGGSAWTEKTLPVLERMLKDEPLLGAANFMVVAGNNPAFHQKFLKLAEGKKSVMTFGFISPAVMSSLLALADVPVLGSLAPATLHELLELRVGPFFLNHYIPGMEKPHVTYIEREGVGLYEPDADKMIENLRAVAGLVEAKPALRRLIDEFNANAVRIRNANKDRSSRLFDFIEGVGRTLPIPYVSRLRRVRAFVRQFAAG